MTPDPSTAAPEPFDVKAWREVLPTTDWVDAHALRCACDEIDHLRVALATLAERLEVVERERRQVPSIEGGSGHEEQYWLRAKLNGSIRHLRDVEDFYRLRGGSPEGFNMLRADRARSLYEQISDDFLNGKTTVQTMRDRAQAAEAEVARLRKTLREIARLSEALEACAAIAAASSAKHNRHHL